MSTTNDKHLDDYGGVSTAPEGCALWSPPSRLRSGWSASLTQEGRHRRDCVPETQTGGAGDGTTTGLLNFKLYGCWRAKL